MQWLVRKGGYSKRPAHRELVRSFLRLINRGRLNHGKGQHVRHLYLSMPRNGRERAGMVC
jgi:hypothetical protein